MARHRGAVLVDTNVIIECWRTAAWKALAGGYAIETVEDCVIETQTGHQRRRPEEQIDRAVLLEGLRAVHPVGDAELAGAIVRDAEITLLDPGERALWAHALTREDAWVVCGPDKASLRIGIRLGLRNRLVCLERLLDDIGFRPREALRTAHTRRWQDQAIVELAQREGKIA